MCVCQAGFVRCLYIARLRYTIYSAKEAGHCIFAATNAFTQVPSLEAIDGFTGQFHAISFPAIGV